MDFAKRELLKFGWTQGKGLGKNEDGIANAIKPTLKYDTSGIGHEIGKEYTNNWWHNMYNKATSNINVVVADNDEIKIEQVGDEVEITTKDYSVRDLKKDSMEYGAFIKASKLAADGVVTSENTPPLHFKQLSDEELFLACGGRTGHKAARHGIKLSGKLSRIEKQEKMLRKKLEAIHVGDAPMEDMKTKKKLKKLKKLQHMTQTTTTEFCCKKRKQKAKKKSVSFDEKVIEIGQHNDDSLQSTSSSGKSEECKMDVIQMRINATPPEPDDEGIEQDYDSPAKRPDLASFTQMQIARKDKQKKHRQCNMELHLTGSKRVSFKDIVRKKGKRGSENCQDVDNVRKIKRKYKEKELNELSDGLEDCRISD